MSPIVFPLLRSWRIREFISGAIGGRHGPHILRGGGSRISPTRIIRGAYFLISCSQLANDSEIVFIFLAVGEGEGGTLLRFGNT